MKRVIATFAFFILATIGTGKAEAQDPVQTNPGKYSVIFENERVRLLEYRDKPGDVSVLHGHPDHLVYSLSDWKREFSLPDGSTKSAEAKAGDAFWAGAGKHSGKNIGSTETRALIFELKKGP